jgi:hypothetical protein
MTLTKKLYEVLLLALVWLPITIGLFLLVDKMEHITGEDWTVYGIALGLVALGFAATEALLEAAGIDTTYAPD